MFKCVHDLEQICLVDLTCSVCVRACLFKTKALVPVRAMGEYNPYIKCSQDFVYSEDRCPFEEVL